MNLPQKFNGSILKIKLHLRIHLRLFLKDPFSVSVCALVALLSVWLNILSCAELHYTELHYTDRGVVSVLRSLWCSILLSQTCDEMYVSIRINVSRPIPQKGGKEVLCLSVLCLLCVQSVALQWAISSSSYAFLKDLNTVNSSKTSFTRFTPGALCNLSGPPCACSNAGIMLKCKSVSCRRGGRESLKRGLQRTLWPSSAWGEMVLLTQAS